MENAQVARRTSAFLDFSEENHAKRTCDFHRSYLTHFLERNSAYRTVQENGQVTQFKKRLATEVTENTEKPLFFNL